MATSEQFLFSIPEVCRLTGLGRTKIYALIAEGEIAAVKVGRRTLIPRSGLLAWIKKLRLASNRVGLEPIGDAVARVVARLPRNREDGDAGS